MIFSRGITLIESALQHHNAIVEGVHDQSAFLDLFVDYFKELSGKEDFLLILPSEEAFEDARLKLNQQGLEFFNLPGDGVSPFSGLDPHPLTSPKRMRCLAAKISSSSKSRLFLSYPEALMKFTLAPHELFERTKKFEFADEFFEDPTAALEALGYNSAPFVEHVGQYSDKGGIIDVFSPLHSKPVRLELSGNDIESLRFFSPENQRTQDDTSEFYLCPARESIFESKTQQRLLSGISKFQNQRSWLNQVSGQIRQGIPFERQNFFLPLFWNEVSTGLSYFKENTKIVFFDQELCEQNWNTYFDQLATEQKSNDQLPALKPNEIFNQSFDLATNVSKLNVCPLSLTKLEDLEQENTKKFNYSTSSLKNHLKEIKSKSNSWDAFEKGTKEFFNNWLGKEAHIFLCCKTKNALVRANSFLKEFEIPFEETSRLEKFEHQVCLTTLTLNQSLRAKEDNLIFIRFEDLFGREKTSATKAPKDHKKYFEELEALRLGELKEGDLVVHVLHGVGLFNGLKIIELQGVPSECVEIHYSGKDKLFLPVDKIYQLRSFSGSSRSVDKLGGTYWKKTQVKVKNKLREIADELIQLYAKRKSTERPALNVEGKDYILFESQFPFEETTDQKRAIDDVMGDFTATSPMDRLICGDVGFGKTEVAMRAAFQAVTSGKQVAILAPTTVLSLQHLQSFEKRFEGWPYEIRGLNRFILPQKTKDTLKKLKDGTVDIVVGTHRLLSQDVEFKNLGLLIVDEEQKFGVKQKEKIKKLQTEIDILTLSATPIPRTLNMGFLGIRDLSLITTPPKDRLPVKTFVSIHNMEIIKQAVENEVKRGGQIYFVHNRVQSIYGIYEELKAALPDVRIGLGHGQMSERDLEKVVLAFFNKEIDLLLSTTIIESGIDIPNANTIMIHNAQNFGLSQLYQLRGRVGRSQKRAYCYLLVPKNKELEKDQKEKLRILQENSELGSGLKIAHHDLELRGAGNLLGEAQAGHVNEIGYDFYVELLEEVLQEARGEEKNETADPEISVPVAALIPSDYIKDFKTRLYYYRRLNQISEDHELDEMEMELQDQFGKVPEEVINLFFLSSAKNLCRKLKVKDLRAGPKNLSLKFDNNPTLSNEQIFNLIKKPEQKYRLHPDQRFLIGIKELSWHVIHEELKRLLDFI